MVLVGSVILITIATVAIMRFTMRVSGTKQLHEDGIVVTDNGIEYLDFFWFRRAKASFSDIESVKLLPSHKAFLSALLFNYGFSIRVIHTRFSKERVLVKLKGPRFFEYLLFTPRNPRFLVEQLSDRIEHKRSNALE